MYCKSCGALMEDSFLACQMCGVKRGIGKAFCDQCGAVRQYGAEFCQECGNKFVDIEGEAPAASVPISQQTPAQQFESAAQMNNSQFMPEKKFCRNCGNQVMNTDTVCLKCGLKVGSGNSYCSHCGAVVANPQQVVCTSCGMNLKPAFNVSEYASKFANNFTDSFKDKDVLSILLDSGAYLISFLTFLFSFLPCCYVSAYFFGVSQSSSFSIWSMSGFCGFLYLLAFLVSVARYVPHVDDFVNNNQQFGKFYIFAPPALMVVSLAFTLIAVLTNAGAGAVASNAYAGASAGFTFLGVLLIIFVLAAVAASVLSYLRKEGKVNF